MSDRANVVLATPAWSLNGPNVFCANLARGLNGRQIPAHIVVTRPDWVDEKPLPPPKDVAMRVLPVGRFESQRARWAAMRRYLESYAPCIYVPNYDVGHSGVSAQLPDSVAVVGIVHSDDPQHYEHVARLSPYWNAVVAVSDAIASEVVRLAPWVEARLSVIPCGVAVAPSLPERTPPADGTLRVIYAGRLDQKQKRVLDLPEILKAALSGGTDVRLTIAGSGPEETALRARCAALGVEEPVEFLGTLDPGALAAVLARQDVFLLPSGFEGMPIGLLEAMGQGCIPVVSDLRSGVREVVVDGGNGYLVTPGAISEFAERLQRLQRDSTLRGRMSRASYEAIGAGGFDLDTMVARYVSLFDSVMDKAGSGAFHRPPGRMSTPPDYPWPEQLPGLVQRAGHYARRLLPKAGA